MKFGRCLSIGLFIWSLSICAFAQAPTVEKVEPPNWWAGHTVNPVRVMVRGSGLAGATVRSARSELRVSNVRVNSRGEYVFFDVAIARNAKPGAYAFELRTASGTARFPFEVSPPPDTRANAERITNDDVIYLIMTDRFADGDAANNKDVDRKNPRAWHGGDFKGIAKRLPYLKELGVTAIWLTPWYDNPDAANECDKPWCPYTNYHGYHAINYYGVENHFGTMDDLRELIRECRRNGIKVIQDQVANHVDIQHAWAKRPPLDNWFSQFTQNTFNDSVLLSPNASQAERDNLLKGWFNPILPDLNQDEPEVSRYLIQNALWWIAMTGIDGIRQDTIQYMPRTFIRDWSAAIRKQYPNYWMVGEVFEEDSAHTAFFQGGRTGWDGIDTQLPSVFDFNLWKTSTDVFTGKKPAYALRDVLKYDGLYGNINNVTVFSNNHDTDRFMSLPGATAEGAMMHMAFTLSVRGIPQLYYGDEIGMTGGHDPDNRKDLPGGFSEDARVLGEAGLTEVERQTFSEVRTWIELRRRSAALRTGRTVDIEYGDDIYVFARIANGQVYVIGVNRSSVSRYSEFDAKLIGLKGAHNICRPHGGVKTIPLSNQGGIDGTIGLSMPGKAVIAYECFAAKK
ncbi:MAG: alpha-amylase family glycosyl hydrolase [Pyrinomonadaceae bacterium]